MYVFICTHSKHSKHSTCVLVYTCTCVYECVYVYIVYMCDLYVCGFMFMHVYVYVCVPRSAAQSFIKVFVW